MFRAFIIGATGGVGRNGDSIGMTHIAIQEALDGKNVDWMELVTDEQYGK